MARSGFHRADDSLNSIKKNFANQDSRKVLEEIWRELLIDPYAEDIVQYLQRSLDELHLSAVDRLKAISVRDLIGQTRNLAERRYYYTQKNEDLRKRILDEGVSAQDLKIYLEESSRIPRSLPLVEALASFSDESSAWVQLQKILKDERAFLEAEIALLERRYWALGRLHQHRTTVSFPEVFAANVITVDEYPLEREVVITTQPEEEVFGLMDASFRDPENVKSLIEDLQNQIVLLRRQVVEMNMDLVHRDRALNERINELSDLRNRMDDVQARFDLGQKIIQEKDVQIELMQRKALEVQKETAERLDEKNEVIHSMAGMMDVYWKRLNDVSGTIDKKDEEMKALMHESAATQRRLDEKHAALRKTHRDLNDFEEQLHAMQKKIYAPLKASNVSISRDILDMEARLRGVKNYLIRQIETGDASSGHLAGQ